MIMTISLDSEHCADQVEYFGDTDAFEGSPMLDDCRKAAPTTACGRFFRLFGASFSTPRERLSRRDGAERQGATDVFSTNYLMSAQSR